MMNSSETDSHLITISVNDLANQFLAAWIKANGVTDSQVQALTGDNSLVVIIEGALTQAERLLAERDHGENSLRQYLKGLMSVIDEEVLSEGGKIDGRQVESVGSDINLEQGWVMWYFKLERKPHAPRY